MCLVKPKSNYALNISTYALPKTQANRLGQLVDRVVKQGKGRGREGTLQVHNSTAAESFLLAFATFT